MSEVKIRIDDVNKVIYGSEPVCNRHIYSKMKDLVVKERIAVSWMFTTKDDILGSDDNSVTIRHSFDLNEDWVYKQEI